MCDSQATSVLCPCKQRAVLQKEQPCSGKTGDTAAPSPAVESEMHHSDSALGKKYDTERDCDQIKN